MNYSFNEEMKNKDADDTNYLVGRHGVSIVWNIDEIEEEIGVSLSSLEDNDWGIKWGMLFIKVGDKEFTFRGDQDDNGFKRPHYGIQFNETEVDY